jgi:hypothetical protein
MRITPSDLRLLWPYELRTIIVLIKGSTGKSKRQPSQLDILPFRSVSLDTKVATGEVGNVLHVSTDISQHFNRVRLHSNRCHR